MAQKIAVMGGCCSGKTTLAGQLAARIGVPHVELDALHHGPNWQETPAEELQRKVEADPPLHVPLARLWRRSTSRIRDGVELWAPGNRETWPNSFFKWNSLLLYTLRTHRRRRREMQQLPAARVVRLRSPAEVADWHAAQG